MMSINTIATTYFVASLCFLSAALALLGLFGLFMFIRSKGTRYSELGYGIGGCLGAWFFWEAMLYVVKLSGMPQ
jgi:hypothetical protein